MSAADGEDNGSEGVVPGENVGWLENTSANFLNENIMLGCNIQSDVLRLLFMYAFIVF